MGQGDKLAACPTELASGDRGRRSRDSSEKRVAVKTCPLGVMDPRREGKGSPPVVGILFSHREKKDPRQTWALSPARPLSGTGHGTGTGSSGVSGRPRPAGGLIRGDAHGGTSGPAGTLEKWTRRDGTLTFDIRGAPESGPTARLGVGLPSGEMPGSVPWSVPYLKTQFLVCHGSLGNPRSPVPLEQLPEWQRLLVDD